MKIQSGGQWNQYQAETIFEILSAWDSKHDFLSDRNCQDIEKFKVGDIVEYKKGNRWTKATVKEVNRRNGSYNLIDQVTERVATVNRDRIRPLKDFRKNILGKLLYGPGNNSWMRSLTWMNEGDNLLWKLKQTFTE